jgi:ABC-type transporter Mla MlaB component
MLRITVVDSPSEEKWILQGQLTGEFASELIANWRVSLDQCSERLRIVDLSDVTQIDRIGEEALCKMMRQHTRFIATGLYTKHLLEELRERIKDRHNDPSD